jgi:integrase
MPTKRAEYGAGSVKQIAPGRYELRWSQGTDPFTGQHRRRTERITAPSLKAARQELAARTSQRRVHSRMTFGDLLDLTLPQLRVKENSRTMYASFLRHVPPGARQWTAADITALDAAAVLDGLTGRHGPQLVRKIHTAIMSCWRQARLNGWVGDFNPWRGQALPKVPVSAGLAFTEDEVLKLRLSCEDQLERVWLEMHLDTGARPGEVLGVRWSAIDLDDSVITFIDAKHRNELRPVAITPALAALIRDWQVRQRARALAAGCGLAPDPYLISNDPASSVPWTVQYAGSFRWRRLRERAGIRPGLRVYDARHTHNSWLAAAGVDAVTRAQRIGNSPATNQRTYSHSLGDRAAAAAIEARRSG